MSLFTDPNRHRTDASQLLAALDAVLRADRAWSAGFDLFDQLAGSLDPVVEETRIGHLPPEVFVVVATAIAVTRPKDYGSAPLWPAAFRLCEAHIAGIEAPVLRDDDLAQLAQCKRKHGAAVAATMRQGLIAKRRLERAMQRSERQRTHRRIEDTIARLSNGAPPEWLPDIRERVQSQYASRLEVDGDAPPGESTPAPPEHVAAADRVAPLGAGGQRRSQLAEARPTLWHNRANGPAWEGLCAAFDVLGAGSQDGLRRLRAVTDAHPESPSLLWLDEIACRVAREARAETRARALDKILASDRFGKGARELCAAVELGRAMIAEKPGATHDAWLAAAAAPRFSMRIDDDDDEPEAPATSRARRRAAARGDEKAMLFDLVESALQELRSGESTDAENEGPFHGLDFIPGAHEPVLDRIAHYTVMGFRPLYALEISSGPERASLQEWARR